MTTEADIGSGATFKLGNGATPEVFTAVAEVTNISLSGTSVDAVEATHMGSGGWREYIPGMGDGGEFSIDLNFTEGGYSALEAKLRTKFNVEIAEPGGAEWTAAVILTSLSAEIPLEDRMTASATFKVSGQPNFAEA